MRNLPYLSSSISARRQNLPKVNKELAMKLMAEGEEKDSRKAKKKAKVGDLLALAAWQDNSCSY